MWALVLRVPQSATPWPQDRAERVSVNSFGIGGANGHVIIDSARAWVPAERRVIAALGTPVAVSDCGVHEARHAARVSRGPPQSKPLLDAWSPSDPYLEDRSRSEPEVPRSQLLVFSATHEKSLARLKSSYETLLEDKTTNPADLARTLGRHRQHHRYRAFCATSPDGEGAHFSATARVSGSSRIVFVFSGQGNVWPRGTENLLRESSIFRQMLTRLDAILASLPACSLSLEKELLRDGDRSRLQDAEIAHPLSVAMQICLCNALGALGVRPEAVVGHSSGEIAAAYVSGALMEEEAIKVAFFRGQAIEQDTTLGAMSSAGLSRDVIDRLALSGVTLACDNSRSSVTLSGRVEEVEEAEASIVEAYPNALVKRVAVGHAYHSRYMRSAGESCERILAGQLRPTRPQCAFYSALRGGLFEESDELGPVYWRQHMEGSDQF